jgi:hypothetical protein
MRKVFRYVRIAFSAVCWLACLLLLALWIRSFWKTDVTHVGRRVDLTSRQGSIVCTYFKDPAFPASGTAKSAYSSLVLREIREFGAKLEKPGVLGFDFRSSSLYVLICMPHVLAAAVAAGLVAAPWVSWSRRFGLRTLFIGLTIVAIVLGAITASMRWAPQ